MKSLTFAAALLALATGVVAHEGVKNETVLARMEAMKSVSENLKVMGRMAKGTAPFDAEAAQVAATRIASLADETPALFEPEENDPNSEARAVIWDEFDRFADHAEDMREAALDAREVEDIDDLRDAMMALGATCRDCHERYRD